jgi:UDP-N-acetylmuramoyl-tripeptide--D-alanyl-D-alanine ligase
LAALSTAQILLRKQRYPQPTSKALALIATAIVINLILILSLRTQPIGYPLVAVIQPFIVLIAWLLWRPVDLILKKRVMDQAAQLRSQMKDVTVIGIAGSVGKTTVKELIAHLTQDLKPLVTPAHVNTEMGVAQWLTNKLLAPTTQSPQLLIVEMGAYKKGEIALLCQIAQPTIGVMTALGSDHLALFGSEQNIIDANGELIAALPKDGHAFFYGDNDGCAELAKRAPCPVTVAANGLDLTHSLEGRHNQLNVALAVSVARHLGIKADRINDLLKTFKPQAHTFSVKTEGGVTILDDTYNISPLSFNAALDWVSTRTESPRVLLTSGLQETGPDEERFLRELGEKASHIIDRVIFTDAHGSDVFAQAFGKPVEILNAQTSHVAARSVLLAVGRMPLSTITRLLP